MKYDEQARAAKTLCLVGTILMFFGLFLLLLYLSFYDPLISLKLVAMGMLLVLLGVILQRQLPSKLDIPTITFASIFEGMEGYQKWRRKQNTKEYNIKTNR